MDENLRILVVDDMPAVRMIVRGMLEEIGFRQIFEAESAESAWSQLTVAASQKSQKFGLVISDWMMQGMSGIDLLRLVRNSPELRDLPFLIITSQGEQDRMAEATQAGATDFVVKPFDGSQLSEKVEQALAPHDS